MAEKKEARQAEKPKIEKGEEDPNALVARFQILQQQLQSVLLQKETFSINMMEIERAMEELGKTTDKTAYKITGMIMVSKPVEQLKKDLEGTMEAVGIRLKGLEKTEQILTQQLKDLQEKLRRIIK